MWAMIVKEFRQLRRDRRTLAMMIVMPVVLLIVFGYAASFDVTTIPTVAVGPQASRAGHVLGKPFETVDVQPTQSRAWAEEQLRDGHAAVAVVTGNGQPEVLIDGSQLFTAKAAIASLSATAAKAAPSGAAAGSGQTSHTAAMPTVTVLYNPGLNTSDIMIPGLAGVDIGRVRETNQDSAYAGSRLLAVADGMGSGEARASAAVIDALKPLNEALPAGDLLNALEQAVEQASATVGGLEQSGLEQTSKGHTPTGTTVTAMLWSGSQLALVHIGDCRAYLLRDGELFQITHDHTVVQSLLDEGRITPDEAASHPQRSLLLRAIDGSAVELDTSLHDARAGDRYLLCSDGLTGVVGTETILGTLRGTSDPDDAAARLIEAANAGGGPDNVSCVVADIVPLPAPVTG